MILIPINPYSLAERPLCVLKANSADPDQTPQIVASDQGVHCLLTVNSS